MTLLGAFVYSHRIIFPSSASGKWFVSPQSTQPIQTLSPGLACGGAHSLFLSQGAGLQSLLVLAGPHPSCPQCVCVCTKATVSIDLSLILMTGRARPPQNPSALPWLLLAWCLCVRSLEGLCGWQLAQERLWIHGFTWSIWPVCSVCLSACLWTYLPLCLSSLMSLKR